MNYLENDSKVLIGAYPSLLSSAEKEVVNDILHLPFLYSSCENGLTQLFIDINSLNTSCLEQVEGHIANLANMYDRNEKTEQAEILSFIGNILSRFIFLDNAKLDLLNYNNMLDALIMLAQKGFLFLHIMPDKTAISISITLNHSLMLSDLFEVLNFEAAKISNESYVKLFYCLISYFEHLTELSDEECSKPFESNYSIDVNELTINEFMFIVIERCKNINIVDFSIGGNCVYIESHSLVFNEYIQDREKNSDMLTYTSDDFVDCMKDYLMNSLHSALRLEHIEAS